LRNILKQTERPNDILRFCDEKVPQAVTFGLRLPVAAHKGALPAGTHLGATSHSNGNPPRATRQTRRLQVPGSSEFSGFACKILEKSC